jgi:hypothetical protein
LWWRGIGAITGFPVLLGLQCWAFIVPGFRVGFYFFLPNAGRNFLAKPPFRHHDPIVHLFHRRAPNHQLVSARSHVSEI